MACYTTSMKKLFIMLMALVCLLPVQAKVDAGQILGGLLQLGGQVLEEQAVQPATTPLTNDSAALTLRGVTDVLLESYKQEGREYAREVGDIITQRIMEDKNINSTLDSMRLFCWAVIIYLTVISLIVLYMLLRLRVLYARIMAELKTK